MLKFSILLQCAITVQTSSVPVILTWTTVISLVLQFSPLSLMSQMVQMSQKSLMFHSSTRNLLASAVSLATPHCHCCLYSRLLCSHSTSQSWASSLGYPLHQPVYEWQLVTLARSSPTCLSSHAADTQYEELPVLCGHGNPPMEQWHDPTYTNLHASPCSLSYSAQGWTYCHHVARTARLPQHKNDSILHGTKQITTLCSIFCHKDTHE